MTQINTVETVEPTIAPFNTSALRSTSNTNVPWGMASHVTSFTAPAIGSGDTGLVILLLKVPANYLLEMNGFHLDMFQTSTPLWDTGVCRLNYTGTNSFSPGYDQTTLSFPLAVTSAASIGSTQYKNVSVASAGQNSAYNVNSPINFLFSSDAANPTDVVIYLYNSTSGVHDTTFNVAINWKLYDIAQGNHPFLA